MNNLKTVVITVFVLMLLGGCNEETTKQTKHRMDSLDKRHMDTNAATVKMNSENNARLIEEKKINAETTLEVEKLDNATEEVIAKDRHEMLAELMPRLAKILGVLGSIVMTIFMGFRLAAFLGNKNLMARNARHQMDIEKELVLEKYRLGVEVIKNILPDLTPEERKRIFEKGGLLGYNEPPPTIEPGSV